MRSREDVYTFKGPKSWFDLVRDTAKGVQMKDQNQTDGKRADWFSSGLEVFLNASKLIMRPAFVAESHLCPAQTDCRCDGAHLRESGRVSENGSLHRRAGARNRCADDYA